MTPRERVQAVYEGKTPDQIPLMLDLSHWYRKNYDVPFDLTGMSGVDQQLVDLHKKTNSVCYIDLGSIFDLTYSDDSVKQEAWTDSDGVYHHVIETPVGRLEAERVFEEMSYSYNITRHLLQSVDDFPVVQYAMERCQCTPRFDTHVAWQEALGELGFVYGHIPYSGLGYLISRNFGIEKTCMAAFDHPEKVRDLVDSVNECNLRIVDAIMDGPFEVMFLSDNFSSDVQSPALFDEYSREFYTEVARRAHAAGKYFSVHVDGEMRGCLQSMAECGVDCIDAATPAPMFALTPAQARAEAGDDLILSGGIPANVFGASGTDEQFVQSVKDWLATKDTSSRLIMAAGDQVPTDAPWHRIEMLAGLVEEFGRY